MKDSTAQGVSPGNSKAWEGHNLVNTCSNGASEESITIYTKNRCQWSGRLIKIEFEQWRYDRLNPQGP